MARNMRFAPARGISGDRTMNRLATVIVCMSVSGSLAVGQDQQTRPVFRSGVDLVTVDVTVVDGAGKPVKGLKADDFVVTLNGERRPVRAIDYLEFGATSAATSDQPVQTTNQLAPMAHNRGGRIILLVVDDLSAKPAQLTALRASAQHMLATLDVGDSRRSGDNERLGARRQPDQGSRSGAGRARESSNRRPVRREHCAVLHQRARGHRDQSRRIEFARTRGRRARSRRHHIRSGDHSGVPALPRSR